MGLGKGLAKNIAAIPKINPLEVGKAARASKKATHLGSVKKRAMVKKMSNKKNGVSNQKGWSTNKKLAVGAGVAAGAYGAYKANKVRKQYNRAKPYIRVGKALGLI
jgi:hypothetical protein